MVAAPAVLVLGCVDWRAYHPSHRYSGERRGEGLGRQATESERRVERRSASTNLKATRSSRAVQYLSTPTSTARAPHPSSPRRTGERGKEELRVTARPPRE